MNFVKEVQHYSVSGSTHNIENILFPNKKVIHN